MWIFSKNNCEQFFPAKESRAHLMKRSLEWKENTKMQLSPGAPHLHISESPLTWRITSWTLGLVLFLQRKFRIDFNPCLFDEFHSSLYGTASHLVCVDNIELLGNFCYLFFQYNVPQYKHWTSGLCGQYIHNFPVILQKILQNQQPWIS